MRTRGKWFDYDTGTRTIRAMATFHPAYLLRSPSYKRMSWLDLRAIAKALEQTPSKMGKAKRAHHPVRARDGGHASLCPPYGFIQASATSRPGNACVRP